MIIKKKYTVINKKEEIQEPVIIQEEVIPQVEEEPVIEEEIPQVVEEKKEDFDISISDITFEQREERREGTRRRGYRRTQDRNIVSRAQQDAQSIKEAAKQDGYKEGMVNAQKDIDELKSQFAEFYNYKDEVFNKVAECIMDVAVEIAGKILKKEVETDSESVLPIIKDAIEEINKTENKITLKVMAKDVELVRDKLPEIFSGNNFEAKISVVPDNEIKDGGVIIETSNGIIDASISTQLAIIEKALKKQEES